MARTYVYVGLLCVRVFVIFLNRIFVRLFLRIVIRLLLRLLISTATLCENKWASGGVSFWLWPVTS